MIILQRSTSSCKKLSFDAWLATTGATGTCDSAPKLPRLGVRLEDAFVEIRDLWWRLGYEMGQDKTADIAHAPTGGAFGSDFGVMLAWSQLISDLAKEKETILVFCDDPWLFRHLATLPGVTPHAPPPPLWPQKIRLVLRGFLARCKVALSCAFAAIRLVGFKKNQQQQDPTILVYGHPRSDTAGRDAYFGSAMKHFSELKRLLHTDCPPARALELIADGRTASLHAWGSPLRALFLVGTAWRPSKKHITGPYGWLIRRAAARENGGGGPAMNRWQLHCQKRWLAAVRPSRLIWPWENHAWERDLCRQAQKLGVSTVGYQHTVIGPHQINYSPSTNPDGLNSIPDIVASNGPAYRDELQAWGIPDERLKIAGAWRFERPKDGQQACLYDPDSPVFVPLSAVAEVGRQQLSAARIIAETGRKVLVKTHPMYPLVFETTANLSQTDVPLAEQGGLSAVLYSTGTSGLEALLAGLPTFRLMLEDRIAIDILPKGLRSENVTLDDVAKAVLRKIKHTPKAADWDAVLAPVDMDLWRQWLSSDKDGTSAETNGQKT
jgi:hypothetical protein